MRILAWFLPLIAAVLAAVGAAGTGAQAGFIFQFVVMACAAFLCLGAWTQRDYGWAFTFACVALLYQPFLETPLWFTLRENLDAEMVRVWAPPPVLYWLTLIFPAHYLWVKRAARQRQTGTLRATDN